MAGMKSPFSGMDPYLEAHWLDVHTRLITYCADELNVVLPENLVARIEDSVAVEDDDWDFREVGPRLRLFSPATVDPGKVSVRIVEVPFKLVIESDPITERFIGIIDEAGQIATIVEFISPTNTRQPALDAYLQKRSALLDKANVSVLVVDLVRAGGRRVRPELFPPKGVAPYRATIRVPDRGDRGYLIPISLRLPLPEVQIPLPYEPWIKIGLQPLVDRVYENGRYAGWLDYGRPLQPPLTLNDAQWAEKLLKEAGKR